MKNYMIGNWKMNQTLPEINSFFETYNSSFDGGDCFVGLAPQTLHLSTLLNHQAKKDFVMVGAQNCSEHQKGAYTGESAPSALKELGATFSLIGHSERRQYFGEVSNSTLGLKIQNAIDEGLTAVYCVGESLQERKQNLTQSVLKDQIIGALKELKLSKPEQLLIAYEPVWAIGTGETATPEQAQEAHQWIRGFLSELTNIDQEIPLLYGGSVKPENVDELLAKPDINGALVGGASLKGESFARLCQFASK